MEDRSAFDAVDVSILFTRHNWRVNADVGRCITYMLQSIDKTTLGYAAVFGVRDDANLNGTEYSWLGSLFYLG